MCLVNSCYTDWQQAICEVFFFQAEDGIRDLVRSRGLGDVYKRQGSGPVELVRIRSDLQRTTAPAQRALTPGAAA